MISALQKRPTEKILGVMFAPGKLNPAEHFILVHKN